MRLTYSQSGEVTPTALLKGAAARGLLTPHEATLAARLGLIAPTRRANMPGAIRVDCVSARVVAVATLA